MNSMEKKRSTIYLHETNCVAASFQNEILDKS